MSKIGWEIYESLDWHDKKILGDQFITATDSFGANLTEGYGRYHYLDKIKFFYNARGSLREAVDYWIELLHERDKVNKNVYENFKTVADKASLKLQNFISSIYSAKNKQ